MKKPLRILSLVLPVLTAAAALAANPDCDRACLRDFVTQYLDAMAAHNPGALPLSEGVRFTEDGVVMKLGEGLWKDASKPGGYRQDILDVREGVAASEVVAGEAGSPVLLALRLKIANRKITEIETQVTRSRKEGALFAIDALQKASAAMQAIPEKSQIMPRDEAIRAAMSYPAGLKAGSFEKVDAPFAPDAYRIENGVVTAGRLADGRRCERAGCENIKTQHILEHPGITSRVLAVDEPLGIVLLRMNFGQTGSYGPGNSLVVWEAFKAFGGQIHAVEAFMKIMPANAPSGWE